jgi:hypothetical protein
MASEYDLYHHPQLNPIIQQKVSNTVLRVSRLCWKACFKDKEIDADCPRNCAENYIQTFDLVLEGLREYAGGK